MREGLCLFGRAAMAMVNMRWEEDGGCKGFAYGFVEEELESVQRFLRFCGHDGGGV